MDHSRLELCVLGTGVTHPCISKEGHCACLDINKHIPFLIFLPFIMHVAAIISLIALATLSIVRAAPTASVEGMPGACRSPPQYIDLLICLITDLVIIEGLVPYNGTEDSLYKRTTRDYSGVNCNKECLGTPGGGPNEADCVVLIEQKLFPRGEKKFAVQPNTAGSITYRSCLLLLYVPYGVSARYMN